MTTQMTVMQVARTKERLRQAMRASYEAERAELGATILVIALSAREAASAGATTHTEVRRKRMMESFQRLEVLDELLAHPESPAIEALVETAFDLFGVELVR